MDWKTFVSKYKQENPHLKLGEVLKQCSQIWNEAHGTEKKEKPKAKKVGGKKNAHESSRIQSFDERDNTGNVGGEPVLRQKKIGGQKMVSSNASEIIDLDQAVKPMVEGGRKKKGGGIVSKALSWASKGADYLGYGYDEEEEPHTVDGGMKRGRKGKGIISDVINTGSDIADLFGLGYEDPHLVEAGKKRGRKGTGIVKDVVDVGSDIADLFGLGYDEEPHTIEGGRKRNAMKLLEELKNEIKRMK